MNRAQNKKNALRNWKYILIAIILAFIVCGGILGYFCGKEKIVPASPVSITPTAPPLIPTTPASIPTPPEEKWETYSSAELCFSIKYPQTVSGVDRCSSNKIVWVPIKVFEDKEDRIVYITQEYYYDNWDSELQKNIGLCKKIICSLELLKGQWKSERTWGSEGKFFSLKGEKTFLGWGILIENIKNESELNKFIKNNYGPGCFVEKKEPWKQDGIYEIKVKGEDWNNGADLGNTNCPWNVAYKILYVPKKNKIISINLGQECTFYRIDSSQSESLKCYDEEMIDSFEFK